MANDKTKPENKEPEQIPMAASQEIIVAQDNTLSASRNECSVPGRMLSARESMTTIKPIPSHLAQQANSHLISLLSTLDATNVTSVQPEINGPDLRPVPRRPALVKKAAFENFSFDDTETVKWHQVSNLPGYLVEGIRMIGEQCFRPFARNYPIGKMLTISTLINPKAEMGTILRWIQKSGRKIDEATMIFNQSGEASLVTADYQEAASDGYKAKLQIWQVGNCRLQLVQDFAGTYVYMWPHSDDNYYTTAHHHGKLGAPKT